MSVPHDTRAIVASCSTGQKRRANGWETGW